jgi:DNA polymerase-3 subunit beta
MKFITTATEFKNALSKVERVTDKRNQLPVLGLVLMKAEKDTITLKATNLDVGIECKIRAKVITDGECAISGAVVISFLSALREDKLEVDLIGGALSFVVGPHTIMVKTTPHDDFPNLPQIQSKKTITLPVGDFTDSIRLVS